MQTENLRINQSKSITQSDDFLSISDMDESSEELELNINKYLKQGQKAYEVLKYAENCEKQNQISYILPLSTTIPRKIIFIILNIITLGIINIFIEWFPKIVLYIHYSVTDLNSATHFGIFSKIDKEFEVVKKELIDLPYINYDNKNSIVKKFNLNIEHGSTQLITFKYRIFMYIYINNLENFEALSYRIKDIQSKIVENYTEGLNPDEYLFMKKIFGECDLDIKLDSPLKLLFDELTDPSYIFILYSEIIWFITLYFIYSTIIIILTIIYIIISINDTYKNIKKIKQISHYSCKVKAIRKNEYNKKMEPIEINSTELVPGDICEIPENGLSMPCDMILISGSVLVNESILKGESTPVIKVRMTKVDEIFDTNDIDCEKYILFAGSKIIQKRKMENSEPYGIVFRTGFNSFKGSIISSILNQEEGSDKFFRDSIKYIVILCIATIIGFLISLKFLIVEGGYSASDVILTLLDSFTTTIPPSLPACLTVSVVYSFSRLRKKGFFCMEIKKINKVGSINTLIFDKTGTLTEDHLEIKGFITTKINKDNKFEFNNFIENIEKESNMIIEHFKQKINNDKNYKNKNKDLLQYYVECLSCCHCIAYVKEKLIGDPIDVSMFESLGWIMKENIYVEKENLNSNYNPLILNYIRPKCEEDLSIPFNFEDNSNLKEKYKSRYELAIVKRFDFDSTLQRMTVIVKNLNENFFRVYCKGSPDEIKKLCMPSTIPENFEKILNDYTIKGYRVLGMAGKSIFTNLDQSQIIKRSLLEKNMLFLGFIIIQNKSKEKVKEFIEKYDDSNLRMLMATGDNINTAICISRDCNLIPKNQDIILCKLEDKNGLDELKWIKMENNFDKDYENNYLNINKIGNENLVNNNNINFYSQEYLKNNSDSSLHDLYPPEKINTNINEYQGHNKEIISEQTKKQKSKVYSRKSTFFSKDSSYLKLKINLSEYPSYLNFNSDSFCIAISGIVFSHLYKLNEKYIKNKNQNNINPLLKNAHDIFRLILKNGRIFAKMIPEDKYLLVKALKKEGLKVLMCGDGANDCPALKAANVGVSLSMEEPSVAASFTSNEKDISCLYELLKEGKCCLANSVQTFKFIILYSLNQFICNTLLNIYQSSLDDFQFLVADLFIIFPMEFFVAMIKPNDKLTYHYPNYNLNTFPIIISISGHFLIIIAFQFGGYKILKNYYKWENICIINDKDEPLPCHENTILFLISHFQYFGTALALFVSKPFRQRLHTNWLLLIYLAGAYFYSIWITINCDNWSKKLFNLFDLEKKELEGEGKNNIIEGGKNIKYYLLILVVVNTIVDNFYEWVIIRYINKAYEKYILKKFKKQIEKQKLLIQNNYEEKKKIKEIHVVKYHRVFYYDRRKSKK